LWLVEAGSDANLAASKPERTSKIASEARNTTPGWLAGRLQYERTGMLKLVKVNY
jgi:hypothetical protein